MNTDDEGHCSVVDGTVEIEQSYPLRVGLLELQELAEAAKIRINGFRPVTGMERDSIGLLLSSMLIELRRWRWRWT